MLARGTERRDLLETVQGYVILKAAIFETGHGFALGHNPGAPSPFVTWQFTEGDVYKRQAPASTTLTAAFRSSFPSSTTGAARAAGTA